LHWNGPAARGRKREEDSRRRRKRAGGGGSSRGRRGGGGRGGGRRRVYGQNISLVMSHLQPTEIFILENTIQPLFGSLRHTKSG